MANVQERTEQLLGILNGMGISKDEINAPLETIVSKFSLPIAINLVSGRPVPKQLLIPDAGPSDQWLRINPNYKKRDTELLVPAGNLSKAELYKLICLLPLRQEHLLNAILEDCYRGDLVCFELQPGNRIKMSADPEHKNLNFYSWDMRPIAINLHFDPDWKPRINNGPGRHHRSATAIRKPKALKLKAGKRGGGS